MSPRFIKQISNRGDVRPPPPELAERQTLLVSGHHRRLELHQWRLLIDSCGGDSSQPITAVVLPGRACVQSD